MALTTRCLDCGTRTSGSRCATCTRQRDHWAGRRKIASGWKWGEVRTAVHTRDRVCVHCGSSERLEVHHRVPLARGGTNELGNLELLCHRCHNDTEPQVNGRSKPRVRDGVNRHRATTLRIPSNSTGARKWGENRMQWFDKHDEGRTECDDQPPRHLITLTQLIAGVLSATAIIVHLAA